MRWPERLDSLHCNSPCLQGDEEILELQFAPFRISFCSFKWKPSALSQFYQWKNEAAQLLCLTVVFPFAIV